MPKKKLNKETPSWIKRELEKCDYLLSLELLYSEFNAVDKYRSSLLN